MRKCAQQDFVARALVVEGETMPFVTDEVNAAFDLDPGEGRGGNIVRVRRGWGQDAKGWTRARV